ncbi:zinc-dependent metalloprotease [Agilicoccus flavus]|uniref:zinc-dependent metalloprotease n=1 Tax=Agilicoccus flavus TaxID=2775968 RepID=UPI001CF69CFE|nr:zinc-dependent metalloprotease [Agilicoccus flavus]
MTRTPQPTAAGGPTSLVDWAFAKSAARRVTPAGPAVDPAQAREVVAALKRAALDARGPVAETARLQTPPEAPSALVVDRPTWIDVNVDSFATIIDPALSAAIERQNSRTGARPMSPLVARVGGKLTGTELAGLLSFVSTKVLGQYELAPGRPAGSARLLLVAPNVLAAERELGVDPDDFRLWVCLHEETHRVQFTAVPWLRDHMVEASRSTARDLAPEADLLLDRLKHAAGHVGDVLRPGGNGLAELFLTPEQRDRLARVTATMALLEGHADVIMDDVGPKIVPSVAHIRAVFDRRREGLGMLDVTLRRLLGLEAKMAQYRDGAAFVRTVVDRVGIDGFNAVWTSPDTLPTPDEITDPAAWVARVHG